MAVVSRLDYRADKTEQEARKLNEEKRRHPQKGCIADCTAGERRE